MSLRDALNRDAEVCRGVASGLEAVAQNTSPQARASMQEQIRDCREKADIIDRALER